MVIVNEVILKASSVTNSSQKTAKIGGLGPVEVFVLQSTTAATILFLYFYPKCFYFERRGARKRLGATVASHMLPRRVKAPSSH